MKLLKRVYLTTIILRHFRAWDRVTESGQRVTVRADRASSARLKAKADRLFRCCCVRSSVFFCASFDAGGVHAASAVVICTVDLTHDY